MSIVLQCLVGLAVLALVQFLWSRRRYYLLWARMPGPLGWPFIGLGLQMMRPEKFLQFMEQRGAQYKSPFISWMGTKCFLYVNDPDTMEIVFNSPQCLNKGDFYHFMASAIGDGLFTSSSPRWNKHRRLINPAFSRPVLNDFVGIFNVEADVLIEKLHNTSGKVEIYEILKRSVLEAACQTTMGKKMNFQNDGSAKIFESYNGITEVCVKRMLSPWLYPDFVYQHSNLYRCQQKVVKVLFAFVENLLQSEDHDSDKVNQTETEKTTAGTTKTNDISNDNANLIENGQTEQQRAKVNRIEQQQHDNAMMHNASETISGGSEVEGADDGNRKSKAIFVEQVRKHVQQGQLTWNDVRDEANVIIAATFETTSTALYLVCLCLAIHPDYQDKLYSELTEIFPDNQVVQVTSEHLERMTYCEMLINEAMRLFSPVPMVLRSVSSDFTLPNGVTLPAGTQIGLDIFNMQRNEHFWGAAAKQFRPELHFGSEESAAEELPNRQQQHPFAFVPFTKGLRMCIGYRYALMLMKVFLAKIFCNFTIRTDATIDDLVIKGTISLKLLEYPLCEIQKR